MAATPKYAVLQIQRELATPGLFSWYSHPSATRRAPSTWCCTRACIFATPPVPVSRAGTFFLLRYDGPFAINQRRYATNESSERTSISLSPHVYPGWPCLCHNNTPTSATEFSDVGRATAIASAGSISAPQFQLDVERARYGRFEYRGSRKLLARSRHVDRSSRQLQHSLGTDPRSA